MARDLWIIPRDNDIACLTSIDTDLDGQDELAVFKKVGPDDVDLYYFNAPVPGDWTYWDALARNPSPLALDLWIIPSGNDVNAATAVRAE